MPVKVWFLRRGGFWAMLARLLLLSPWDEVAIEYRGVFYVVNRISGVATMGRVEFEWAYPKRTFSMLRVDDPERMTYFLSRQISRPFDWRCYVPFFRRKSWTRDIEWFSSELIACALRYAGCTVDTTHRRCTPSQLWQQLPKVVVYRQV